MSVMRSRRPKSALEHLLPLPKPRAEPPGIPIPTVPSLAAMGVAIVANLAKSGDDEAASCAERTLWGNALTAIATNAIIRPHVIAEIVLRTRAIPFRR